MTIYVKIALLAINYFDNSYKKILKNIRLSRNIRIMQGINNSNDYRAQNIKDAYRVCDVRPLEEAEELAKYYYDLSDTRYSQAIGEVSVILDNLRQGENKTILFTGHLGGGKTTELKKIANEWSKNYFIIFFNVNDELNINDTRYTDLYLAIIKQVESQLRHKGIALDKKLMETFADWFKEITNETEETVERSIGIEGSMEAGTEIPFLAKLWLKILAQIKSSEKQKRTISPISSLLEKTTILRHFRHFNWWLGWRKFVKIS
jgi:hypothetical protein